ncbi:MAG: transporter substrate-binding domain-containing protein [Cyanobacteria bacterium K_DeepCast_35m_m2_155]|nr:transporter substrate-binding domain-containing protein [Cyanobacteria bacterium K_DeepCast_35m_m2_155]
MLRLHRHDGTAELVLPMGVGVRRPLRVASAAALGLGLALSPAAMPPALAEGVLERVARTGQLRLIGPIDHPPMLSVDAKGQPQGYGALVARRIADLVAKAVGKPVQLVYEPVADSELISQKLGEGKAELACGLPFTWAREEVLDFTFPIAMSGLRLIAPAGRLDGTVASLAGQRIGVVRDSLADTQLRGMQPAAQVQTYLDLAAALKALAAGQLNGVIGDTAILAGLTSEQGLQGMAQTPVRPYLRYPVACAVPENASAYRGLANRAIVQLLQGYIEGIPADVSAVDRWIGPGTALGLSQQQIRGAFDALLLGVEPLRVVVAVPASAL